MYTTFLAFRREASWYYVAGLCGLTHVWGEIRLRYASPLSLPRTLQGELPAAAQASVLFKAAKTSGRSFSRHAPEFIDDPAAAGLVERLSAAYAAERRRQPLPPPASTRWTKPFSDPFAHRRRFRVCAASGWWRHRRNAWCLRLTTHRRASALAPS